MDDRRFDALARSLGQGGSRRALLKGLLGLSGVAAVGGLTRGEVEAARRPTPTPKPRTCPGVQFPCGTSDCCCPDGTSKCGPDCCPNDQAQCCDNACCYGTCYGEELCCASPDQYCSVDGCCSGVCVGEGQFCCRPAAVCGDACCLDTEYCCTPSEGVSICRGAGQCCVDANCDDGTCVDGACVPNPPPLDPSFLISFTDVGFGWCSPVVSMSGFAPNTTYAYHLDLRHLSTGQTNILFQGNSTTDALGEATEDRRADLTPDFYEVRAYMDDYSSGWTLVSC